MNKICGVWGNKWNDWFMRLIEIITFSKQRDWFACQSCRDLSMMGYSTTDIKRLNEVD